MSNSEVNDYWNIRVEHILEEQQSSVWLDEMN